MAAPTKQWDGGKLGPMSDALPYDHHRLCELAGEIIVNVRELAALGWTPATSSNFSRRLDDRHAAITVSGRDKGRLREADIMVVDFDGKAVGSDHRPSAEALLHTQLYRRFGDVGCVLHTHSQVQTVASRLFAGAGHVRLEGYELPKAFSGNTTHETELDLPRSEEHTSELQSLMRISYAVFCL